MRYKTKRRMQGAISLMLVIILLPMMTLSALLVDTARYNMAKSMVSSAGDLAMNAALADYDTVLKDVYGLFAMAQSEEEWQANVKQYFEDCVVNYGVVSEEDAGNYVAGLLGDLNTYLVSEGSEPINFMEMDVEEISVRGVEESALSNPEILRKQIVEFMKYRGPLSIGASFLNSMSAFTKVSKQAEVVEKQVAAQEKLTPVNESAKKLYEWLKVFDKLHEEGSQTYVGPDGTQTKYQFDVNLKTRVSEPKVETIQDYESVLGEVKDKMPAANYTDINQLFLIFFKGAYTTIYDLGDADEVKRGKGKLPLLNANGDYITKNGNTYAVSIANLTETNFSEKGIDELRGDISRIKGNLTNLQDLPGKYSNAEFFKLDWAKSDKSTFTNQKNAQTDFLEFTKFLKNKIENLKYTDVNTLFKNIDNYAKAIAAYNSKVDEEISNCRQEIQQFNEEIQNIEQDTQELKKQITSYQEKRREKQKEYIGQQKDIDNDADLKAAYEKVEANLKEIENLETVLKSTDNQSKRKNFQKQIAEKEKDNETIKNEHPEIRDLYNVKANIDGLTNKIDTNRGKINENNREKGRAESGKNAAESREKDLLNEKKTENQSYQTILKRCHSITKAYQEDVKRYWNYVDTARNLINEKTEWIAVTIENIIKNLKQEQRVLEQAKTEAGTLLSLIDEYTAGVQKWQSATNAYGSSDTGDSFYDTNASEAEQSLKTYDKEQIKKLKEGIENRYHNISNLIQHIEKAKNYCYGEKKIKDIKSVIQLREASTRSGNVDIAESTIINDYMKQNYKAENPTGDNSIQNSEFTRFEASMNEYKFYYYLQATFPEEEGNLSSEQSRLIKDENQTDGKDAESVKNEYKNVKENANENGKKQEDTLSNGFGYSYQGKAALDTGALPSLGSGQKEEEDTNKKFSFDDEQKNSMSSSMSGQVDILNSMLGGLSNALTAGRDNLYILAYIFENFSYNTVVQELGTAGGVEVTLGTKAEDFKNYFGKAKTLTNINLNDKNNYLYGAEVEYILYGNTNPSANVVMAKGSIYATRFVFNSIYAFTDKEIKASTMAAGMTVQAATLGIVPYKVVQIVLQIALALAESAIDLQQMSMGAKIAVIKTKDTWILGSGGLKQAAVDVAKEEVKDMTRSAIEAASKNINNTMNQLIDAGADKASGLATELITDVENSTQAKADEIISSVFDTIESKLYEKLEAIVFMENMTADGVKNEISSIIGQMKSEGAALIAGYTDTVGATIATPLETAMNEILDQVETELFEKIDECSPNEIMVKIVSYVTDIKISVNNLVKEKINKISGTVKGKVNDLVGDYKTKIKAYAAEATGDAKQKILDETNNYIDHTFNSISDKIDTGITKDETGISANRATSKTIKFGYKDYLMLFTYIGICTNGDDILRRTADVIQLNISNAQEGSDLFHKSGNSFSLNQAYTYVTLNAQLDLHMLFLKMDLFSNQVDVFNSQLSQEYPGFEEMDVNNSSSLQYIGIMGY